MSQLKRKRIPDTDSIAELAQFWDTHDLTDFEDELEEVTEPVFQREAEVTIPLRLRLEEVEVAKKVAKSLGTSYVDLIRAWVRERIHAS